MSKRDLIVAFVFIIAASILLGFLAGSRWEQDKLPDCQEDEYLYPSDYLGPGQNDTGDYNCIHVDVITNSN